MFHKIDSKAYYFLWTIQYFYWHLLLLVSLIYHNNSKTFYLFKQLNLLLCHTTTVVVWYLSYHDVTSIFCYNYSIKSHIYQPFYSKLYSTFINGIFYCIVGQNVYITFIYTAMTLKVSWDSRFNRIPPILTRYIFKLLFYDNLWQGLHYGRQ